MNEVSYSYLLDIWNNYFEEHEAYIRWYYPGEKPMDYNVFIHNFSWVWHFSIQHARASFSPNEVIADFQYHLQKDSADLYNLVELINVSYCHDDFWDVEIHFRH